MISCHSSRVPLTLELDCLSSPFKVTFFVPPSPRYAYDYFRFGFSRTTFRGIQRDVHMSGGRGHRNYSSSDDALAKLLEPIETLSWAHQCVYPDPSYTQRGRHGGHDCAGIAVHTRAGDQTIYARTIE
jgi:hypothetical protein